MNPLPGRTYVLGTLLKGSNASCNEQCPDDLYVATRPVKSEAHGIPFGNVQTPNKRKTPSASSVSE
jgi:hypothetical protein